jgi:hypothetical protein
MVYIDRISDGAQRRAEQAAATRRADLRRRLDEIVRSCAQEVQVLDVEIRSLVSISERITDDGVYSYTLVVDEGALERPGDEDAAWEVLIKHHLCLDAIQDKIILGAKYKELRPFDFVVKDKVGTTRMAWTIYWDGTDEKLV